jgi:hypothetical protein
MMEEDDKRAISGKPQGMTPYTKPSLYDDIMRPASIGVGPTRVPAMGRVGNVAVPAVRYNTPLQKPLDIPMMPATFDIGPTQVPKSGRVGGVVVPAVHYGVGSQLEWQPGMYPFRGGLGPNYGIRMRYGSGISVPEAGMVGGVAVPRMRKMGGVMVPAAGYLPEAYYGTGSGWFSARNIAILLIGAVITCFTVGFLRKKKIIKFGSEKSKIKKKFDKDLLAEFIRYHTSSSDPIIIQFDDNGEIEVIPKAYTSDISWSDRNRDHNEIIDEEGLVYGWDQDSLINWNKPTKEDKQLIIDYINQLIKKENLRFGSGEWPFGIPTKPVGASAK